MRPRSTAPADPAVAAAQLPELRVLASADLLLHEDSDPQRVERLGRALAADGVLRNPPVVAPLDGGQYVVLDGANRVTALRQAGFTDQLAQVVSYDDASVSLEVWAHALRDDVAPPLGGAWRAMPVDAIQEGLESGSLGCGVITASGSRGFVTAPDLAARVAAVAGVVAGYKGRIQVYRVQPASLDSLRPRYGRVGALVLFPQFSKADIGTIARLPVLLPSGVSRHIVQNRALRVNVELSLLRGAAPREEKQARLTELITQRLVDHRVRHYPESTVVFDD
jgi:hypothetical protein